VTCGRSLVYRFEVGDLGMRNLAIVALTDADRRVDEVAAVFGLSATYVSMLRGRAGRGAGLGRVGPPPWPPAQALAPAGRPGQGMGGPGGDPAGGSPTGWGWPSR